MTEDDQTAPDELSALRARNDQLEASLKQLKDNSDKRLIDMELRTEAVKAGMIDLDGLKLIDLDKITLDEKGNVQGAAAALARMRREKAWMFNTISSSSLAAVPLTTPSAAKLATEMTLDEWRAARAELLRRR